MIRTEVHNSQAFLAKRQPPLGRIYSAVEGATHLQPHAEPDPDAIGAVVLLESFFHHKGRQQAAFDLRKFKVRFAAAGLLDSESQRLADSGKAIVLDTGLAWDGIRRFDHHGIFTDMCTMDLVAHALGMRSAKWNWLWPHLDYFSELDLNGEPAKYHVPITINTIFRAAGIAHANDGGQMTDHDKLWQLADVMLALMQAQKTQRDGEGTWKKLLFDGYKHFVGKEVGVKFASLRVLSDTNLHELISHEAAQTLSNRRIHKWMVDDNAVVVGDDSGKVGPFSLPAVAFGLEQLRWPLERRINLLSTIFQWLEQLEKDRNQAFVDYQDLDKTRLVKIKSARKPLHVLFASTTSRAMKLANGYRNNPTAQILVIFRSSGTCEVVSQNGNSFIKLIMDKINLVLRKAETMNQGRHIALYDLDTPGVSELCPEWFRWDNATLGRNPKNPFMPLTQLSQTTTAQLVMYAIEAVVQRKQIVPTEISNIMKASQTKKGLPNTPTFQEIRQP